MRCHAEVSMDWGHTRVGFSWVGSDITTVHYSCTDQIIITKLRWSRYHYKIYVLIPFNRFIFWHRKNGKCTDSRRVCCFLLRGAEMFVGWCTHGTGNTGWVFHFSVSLVGLDRTVDSLGWNGLKIMYPCTEICVRSITELTIVVVFI